MNLRLLALDTADDIPLKPGLMVVGRHPTCDFRIRSPKVSRVHCCFHSDGDRLFVRDLNSTNGIRVNGRPVLHAELNAGDVLAIAQMHFKCIELEAEVVEYPGRSSVSLCQEDPSHLIVDSPVVSIDDIPISMPITSDVHESSVEIRVRTGS